MTRDLTDPYAQLPPRPVPSENYTKEVTYRHTRAPVDLAVTLIPDAYTSQEFLAIEREKVFASSWVVVGCTSQVEKSGQVIVAEVAGRSIIVTRDKKDKLRAFHNVCRHRATKLLDDGYQVVRNSRIRCPYHSWTYDLEGNCLGTPLFEGSDIPEDQQDIFGTSGVKGFDKADYGLLPVGVESWGFLIFVNLNPDAAPLAEYLGDLPERCSGYRLEECRVVREKTYEIAANYKLIGENFMEFYHLPWVHPELVQVSRMEDHYRWQGPGMYMGFLHHPYLPEHRGRWLAGAAAGGLSERHGRRERAVHLSLSQHCRQHSAQPRLRHDHTSRRAWARRGGNLSPLSPRVRRESERGQGAGPAGEVLGFGEPAGHRDRRAGAGRYPQPGVPGRTHVLPL
jgi:choline monooxygenase